MSEERSQHPGTSSGAFGAVAGASSADTKDRQTGNELNEELKAEGETKEPVAEILFKEPLTPLFVSDSSEGDKGTPQDEKDETEE